MGAIIEFYKFSLYILSHPRSETVKKKNEHMAYMSPYQALASCLLFIFYFLLDA